LKERQISRATADRLVSKHERSLSPESNCLSEAIPEPTEEQIQMLLNKVAPKLRRILRTPTSVYRFLELLASAFEGLDRRVTADGLVVVKPSTHTPVEQSVPEEAQVAPVPVIAEVLPEGDVQSTGTSMAQ
jgi:hypothetical protein